MRDLKSSTTMALLSLLAISFCETFAARGLAGKPHGGTAPFHVAVLDAKGTSVAGDTQRARIRSTGSTNQGIALK